MLTSRLRFSFVSFNSKTVGDNDDEDDNSDDQEVSDDNESDDDSEDNDNLPELSDAEDEETTIPSDAVVNKYIGLYKKYSGLSCPNKQGVAGKQGARTKNLFCYGYAAYIAYYCVTGKRGTLDKPLRLAEESDQIELFVRNQLEITNKYDVDRIMNKRLTTWVEDRKKSCKEGWYKSDGSGDVGIYYKYKHALKEVKIAVPNTDRAKADKAKEKLLQNARLAKAKEQARIKATSEITVNSLPSESIPASEVHVAKSNSPQSPMSDIQDSHIEKEASKKRKGNKKQKKGSNKKQNK